MKSISEVEFMKEGVLIKVTSQLEVERAIISKNSQRFQLAYNSTLFNKTVLKQIRLLGETKAST